MTFGHLNHQVEGKEALNFACGTGHNFETQNEIHLKKGTPKAPSFFLKKLNFNIYGQQADTLSIDLSPK